MKWCLWKQRFVKKEYCTCISGHLLVNILLFSVTIVIPVVIVCCLEYPHIQAYRLKPFMIGYAADLASILFLLHHHPFHLTEANTFTAGGHDHTVTTLTPR